MATSLEMDALMMEKKGLAKHLLPFRSETGGNEIITIFQTRVLFTHNMSHLFAISLALAFICITTYKRYGFYACIMTGNLYKTIELIFVQDSLWSGLHYAMIIFGHSHIGGITTCFLLEKTSKEIACLYIWLAIILFSFLLEVSEYMLNYLTIFSYWSTMHKAIVIQLLVGAVISGTGALSFWSTKLGFITPFQTGNFFRLAESIYKWSRNYAQVLYFFSLLSPLHVVSFDCIDLIAAQHHMYNLITLRLLIGFPQGPW